MKKKKIAIIGQGTAGCLAVSQLNMKYPNTEVIWYHSPYIKAQSVGEGSILGFPQLLRESLDMGYKELKEIDGTFKHGIRKINWGGSGDFIHPFPLNGCGLHFNANKFQKYVTEYFNFTTNIVEQHIKSHNDIDADYIIDCTGTPKNFKETYISPYISVNAAHVTQCYWDYPKFDYTLTIARPYGWVFGIPLKNRCSIGYIYNSDISTLDEVKEDVKHIFEEYGLIPSETTNSLSFKNYYRKENFTNRVAYNGNASFFLEPIEATSIGMAMDINDKAFDIIYNNKLPTVQNYKYLSYIKEIEHMISLHYLAGSKFNTEFWDFSLKKAISCFKNQTPENFKYLFNLSQEYQKNNRINAYLQDSNYSFSQWSVESYNIHLKEFDLNSKIYNIINN